jgi:hypothetical protein
MENPLRILGMLTAAIAVTMVGTSCVDRDPPPGTTRYNRGQVIAIANAANEYQDRWWGDPILVQRPQSSGPESATTHWRLVYRDLQGRQQLVRVNAHTAWVNKPVALGDGDAAAVDPVAKETETVPPADSAGATSEPDAAADGALGERGR